MLAQCDRLIPPPPHTHNSDNSLHCRNFGGGNFVGRNTCKYIRTHASPKRSVGADV